MGIRSDQRCKTPFLEALEPRLMLSVSFDLDGDTVIGAGDQAIFDAVWQKRGGYAFSDSLLQPGDEPGWDHRADFDGDFHVGTGDYAWLSTNWGLGEFDPIEFPEDPHDDDQYTDDAFAKGAFAENQWFSDQYGSMAIAGDTDWFYIDVPAGRPIVNVDCRFLHAEGNIDVRLHAVGGSIARGDSTTDNESFEVLTSGGMHYLRVYPAEMATGQRYDVRWWAEEIPDDHEQDDNVAQADALGAFPQETWYSEEYGYRSVQSDTDYFAIDVLPGQTYLTIDVTFLHAEGDINIQLWSEDYVQIIEMSASDDDNERIELNLADFNYDPGRYYAVVQGPNSGQLYDLRWNAQPLDFRAVDDAITIDEDSVDNPVAVLDNDIGDNLEIVPTPGTWTDGTYVYITPYPNTGGQQLFGYTIKQTGGSITDSGLIVATIIASPDAPVALDDVAEVDEDTTDNAIDVLANDSDADGDPLTITGAAITSAAPIGSVWHDDDYVYYTPTTSSGGTETIEYTIDDGTGRTATAEITVDVGTDPDDPVAEDDFFSFVTGMHKNTLHVMANDSDPDGDSFTIIGFPDPPDEGEVTTDGLIVEYEPGEGYVGFDSFDYTIEDSTGRTATATVDVHVLPSSDIHEEDDNLAQADALGVAQHRLTPLHLLDEDYFMVELHAGAADRLWAATWSSSAVDMELLDDQGDLVATSTVDHGREIIDTTSVSPGKYYIHFTDPTGTYWGAGYDLEWDSFGPGDPHEPDDTFVGSDALGPLAAGVMVGGISNDDDFYRIEVPAGDSYITATCHYDLDDGNLDLELFDYHGQKVAGSYSTWSARDEISMVVEPDVYYLRVISPGGFSGQAYELLWSRVATEDPHEGDDTIPQADAKGWFREDYTFHSQYGRLATQTDNDFYRIDIRSGHLDVDVDCWFTDGHGDIDLHLVDKFGTTVAMATTTTSNEHIDYVAPAPGNYYIRVYTHGSMSGLQTYDLKWRGNKSDDTHEEDDDKSEGSARGLFAADTSHSGVLWDRDVYEIDVPVGHLEIEVDCLFDDSEGNIDVAVKTRGGYTVDGGLGNSHTDNEHLTASLGGSGRYYVHVYAAGGYTGQSYDLSWTPIVTDDPHEQDDSFAQSDARGPFAQNNSFSGQQWDDDIYRLEVPQGYDHVKIDCTFDPSEGDIDLLLVDASHSPVAASTGLGDGEHIDTVLGGHGTYYLLVYDGAGGFGTGQKYILSWSAVQADDSHENDNSFALADIKGDFNSGYWRDGRAWDSDYYRINVPGDAKRVTVDCTFDHDDGNITLVLYDSNGELVDLGNSVSDNEHLDLLVDPGRYYINVITANAVPGQQYSLRWDAMNDDAHEEDDWLMAANARGALQQNRLVAGVQQDDDYYKIVVSNHSRRRIWASCNFDHSDGDIDLYLSDSNNQVLAISDGESDREEIFYTVPSTGTYYLRVHTYGTPSGQLYELRWKDNATSQYDWTFMAYMDGDNNLEGDAYYIYDDIVDANMPSSIPVTVLIDGFDGDNLGYSTTRRGIAGGALTDLGELNMGSMGTLYNFIDWSMTNYPAEKYALMFFDHGGGFTGCCSDDTDGDGLSMPEISDVLSSFPMLEVVAFDACVMATVGTAYQLVGEAEYMIASECNMSYPGIPMTQWLTSLKNNPSMSGSELAIAADSVYSSYYESHDRDNRMMSTAILDEVPDLVEALDAFADAVVDNASDDDWIIIQNAKFTGSHFGSYRDIEDMMNLLVWAPALHPAIRATAANVLAQLPPAILTNYHGSDVYGAGLTLYARDGISFNDAFNDDLFFVRDTDWEVFITDVPSDNHESDDSYNDAIDRGWFPRSTLRAGTYYNQDYYLISVPAGQPRVTIDLTFSHSDGDLDLELYDWDENLLVTSDSKTNNEFINFLVTPNEPYFIRVASKDGLATGQSYNLIWGSSAGAPQPAGSPPAELDVLDVEYVVRYTPSPGDTSPGLPASLTQVDVDETFYLEVWIKNKNALASGIVGGYIDLWYDDMLASAGTVDNGGIYTDHAVSGTEFGSIQFGGVAAPGVMDVGDDEWARLGYVEFTADNIGWCSFMTSGGMDHFARAHEGKVRWFDVEMDDPLLELLIFGDPPEVTVDLQPGSDSGVSDTDNITNDMTPTFDVTVNMYGEISIDYDGDGVWDYSIWAEEAGTYQFTPLDPLCDGQYPVNVEFGLVGIAMTSDSEPITIDTFAPNAWLSHPMSWESIPEGRINVHERYIGVTVIDFEGSGIDPGSLTDAGAELSLSGAAAVGVTPTGSAVHVVDDTYTYSFTGDFLLGNVDVHFIPGSFADLAGNTNDPWSEGFTVVEGGGGGVVGRHVFYNNSAWDGNDPAANPADDGAIAIDKSVLLPGPGEFVSPANYTNYHNGINGIMVDIEAIPGIPTDQDFSTWVNDPLEPNAWSPGPDPLVDIRPGDGVDGSDRVTLIWPDGSIANQWVEVTVHATAETGLDFDDTFYLANCIGDCTGDGIVGSDDYAALGEAFGIRPGVAGIPADFNGDGRVDLTDFAHLRASFGNEVLPLDMAPVAPQPDAAPEAPILSQPVDYSDAGADPVAGAVHAQAIDILGASKPIADSVHQLQPTLIAAQPPGPYREATGQYDLRPDDSDPSLDAEIDYPLVDLLEAVGLSGL